MSETENGIDSKEEDEILSLRESIRLNTQAIRNLSLQFKSLANFIADDKTKKIPLWTHVITMIATVAIMAAAHIVMLGQAMGNKYFVSDSFAQEGK